MLSLKLEQQIQGEEKQRNTRKITEGTGGDLDLAFSCLAIVRQGSVDGVAIGNEND